MDEIYAIIPVTKFKNAKTRLSPFLTEDEREKLLKAMLRDVTDTLKKHVDEIIIISRDEQVLKYAESLNVTTLLVRPTIGFPVLDSGIPLCKFLFILHNFLIV